MSSTPPDQAVGRRALTWLFAISLAVKLLGVAYMNQALSWNLMAPDALGSYRPVALSLVKGEGYAVEGDAASATRIAPVFPTYLAGVYRVFGTEPPVWLLGSFNAAMRASVTVLIAILAARAFGPQAGIAAGLLHAVDPWDAFWSAFVLKESLAILLFVLAVVAWWRMAVTGSTWWGFLAGCLGGLAGLTRFASLGIVPWIVLALGMAAARGRRSWRDSVRLAVALSLGLAIVLAPWVLRNRRIFNEWLISDGFTGRYLYVSNGPGATRVFETWGYSGLATGDVTLEDQSLDATNSMGERDRILLRATLRHIASHPGEWLRAVAARLVNMWRPTFAGSSLANLVLLGIPYVCVMLLAVRGGWALIRGRARRSGADRSAEAAASVLAGAVLFYLVLHLFFWSEIRYRQYVMPFIAAYGGVGLIGLVRLVLAPRSRASGRTLRSSSNDA